MVRRDGRDPDAERVEGAECHGALPRRAVPRPDGPRRIPRAGQAPAGDERAESACPPAHVVTVHALLARRAVTTTYRRTVQLASDGPVGGATGRSTLAPVDAGARIFTLALPRLGRQTITVADPEYGPRVTATVAVAPVALAAEAGRGQRAHRSTSVPGSATRSARITR